jgi:hypothetical protein
MRRRDFGTISLGALGLAWLGKPTPAHAAETLGRGADFKVKSKKKDDKFWLLPSAMVNLKPGQELKFVYVAEFGEAKAPAFRLVEVSPGTGTEGVDVRLEGAPSPAVAALPKTILLVHLGAPKGEPIVVEQPGS